MFEHLFLYAALTWLPLKDKAGWWTQEAIGYESDHQTSANTVGLGATFDPFVIRIQRTSAYSQGILYITDDEFYNGCTGECTDTVMAYNRQTDIRLTGAYTWNHAILGVDLARIDWRHSEYQASRDGAKAKRFNDNHWFRVRDVDYVLGLRIGYQYSIFSIEYAQDVALLQRTGVCCPPSDHSWSVGLSVPFRL
jgi:hypothetical protein